MIAQLSFPGIGHNRPPALERETHIAVADWIARDLKPDWFAFHPANGEYRPDRTGELLKRMLVRPGVSDLLFLGPGPAVCALELKRRGNRPTESQKAFLAFVRAIGGHAEVANGFEEAIGIMTGWGVLQGRLRLT